MADTKTPDLKPAVDAPITMKDVLALIPTMIASAVQASKAASQPTSNRAATPTPQCTECRQALSGCEGKHVKMVVHPGHFAEYFPGAIINGIRYLSNDSGHMVLVPAACESTILSIVANYEQNERDMAVGRKRDHHSGSVSPHGSSVNPANAAWR